jgi:hypothetical protein
MNPVDNAKILKSQNSTQEPPPWYQGGEESKAFSFTLQIRIVTNFENRFVVVCCRPIFSTD